MNKSTNSLSLDSYIERDPQITVSTANSAVCLTIDVNTPVSKRDALLTMIKSVDFDIDLKSTASLNRETNMFLMRNSVACFSEPCLKQSMWTTLDLPVESDRNSSF